MAVETTKQSRLFFHTSKPQQGWRQFGSMILKANSPPIVSNHRSHSTNIYYIKQLSREKGLSCIVSWLDLSGPKQSQLPSCAGTLSQSVVCLIAVHIREINAVQLGKFISNLDLAS